VLPGTHEESDLRAAVDALWARLQDEVEAEAPVP
jgi:dephospho-CoA kinase